VQAKRTGQKSTPTHHYRKPLMTRFVTRV
jgi:hypothetical protein